MISVGFTGTREGLTDEQREEVTKILKDYFSLSRIQGPSQFHHGDCIGADYEAAQIAQEMGYHVVGHPPANDKARAFFESDNEREPKGYLARNEDIVQFSDVLIACPKSIVEEIKGSGTWWTVRYARRIKKPIYLVLPTGRVVNQ